MSRIWPRYHKLQTQPLQILPRYQITIWDLVQMPAGVNRADNQPVQTGKRRAVHALSTHVDSAPLEFEFQAVYYITAGT